MSVALFARVNTQSELKPCICSVSCHFFEMATAGTGNGAMTTAMVQADIDNYLGQLQPELEYILTDAGVHKDVQAKIVSTGFGECRLFAKLDCGEGEKGARMRGTIWRSMLPKVRCRGR